MQIKTQVRYWALLVFSVFLLSTVYAREDEENKLVEYKGFGQWEIWCLDLKQSGNIECNLNHVLRYKNHPDFRAMIFRFYSDGDHVTRMEIDREWQTSFSKGFFQVGDLEPISLADCEKDCTLEQDKLEIVIEQFSVAEKASIRFHDYLVQEFEENIPLSSFAQGLQSLKKIQSRY